MERVATLVSSGASDWAYATNWPPTGTVASSCVPGLGQLSVRYAAAMSSGTIEFVQGSSVSCWPTKMSGIDRSTGLPSTSVATTPKQNGLPLTYGQKARIGLDASMAWPVGSSISGDTRVVIRIAV